MQLRKMLLKSQVENCVSYSKSDDVFLPQKDSINTFPYTVNKNFSLKAPYTCPHTHIQGICEILHDLIHASPQLHCTTAPILQC